MQFWSGFFALVVGFGLGMWFERRETNKMTEKYEVVSAELATARKGQQMPAVNVVSVPAPDTVEIVSRVIRRVVDTVVRIVGDTVIILDTVETVMGGVYEWTFGDTTTAYTLTGKSHADLVSWGNSFTEYKLNVNERAVCPRRWRGTLGGGVFAGRPFFTAGYLLNPRLSLGAMIGAESKDNDLVALRYGVQFAYGIW